MPSSYAERVDRTTELRHVSNKFQLQLSNILGSLGAWKQLMAAIPRRQLDASSFDESTGQLKYKSSEIKDIELASKSLSQPATIILFEEWGTSGQVRPTVGHLMTLLLRLDFYRAADFVAEQMLHEPAPIRPLSGPAARVDISLSDDSPVYSAPVSLQLNTLDNQNLATKIGPTEVQKVATDSMDDLIEFSAFKSNVNLDGPNESLNFMQFSANDPRQSNQHPNIPTNISNEPTPEAENHFNISAHSELQSSSNLPMLQDLLPSNGDISSSVIPQFSTLLGNVTTNSSHSTSSSSAFIPITVNSEVRTSNNSSSLDFSSNGLTTGSSAHTVVPDESSEELSAYVLPAVLDGALNSSNDLSLSNNIPLLSALAKN